MSRHKNNNVHDPVWHHILQENKVTSLKKNIDLKLLDFTYLKFITQIQGAGNSTELLYYSATDMTPVSGTSSTSISF